jgi:hypothetical protein
MVFFRASAERVVVLARHVRQSPDVWPFAR